MYYCLAASLIQHIALQSSVSLFSHPVLCMTYNAGGKCMFITVASREGTHNPFVGGRGGNIITGTVELNEVTVHQHRH